MEEDMAVEEEQVEYTFTAHEVDIDYEFDAVRFFDFGRSESPLEARQAEAWFESAGRYPLLLVTRNGDLNNLMGNVNVFHKSTDLEGMGLMNSDSNFGDEEETSPMNADDKGLSTSTHDQMVKYTYENNEKKSPMKPSLPRRSTLMKPTMSQLAKKNQPVRATYSRSSNSSRIKPDKSRTVMLGIENQAAKRQKLEGGLLRKVQDAMQMQQTNFVHKTPNQEGLQSSRNKSAITVPKEPDLATDHRAQRIRLKANADDKTGQPVFRKFKALPLNRKILEAPSWVPKKSTSRLPSFQEFHLKTSERASQKSSASSKTSACLTDETMSNASTLTFEMGNKEPSSIRNSSKPESCRPSHGFNALPLNKKVFSSKGELGVFHITKKETTVPMEFNFQSGKKSSHADPPTELFNKLSLASEVKQTASTQKGPKENR